jgi:hypothetical protein
MSKFVSPTHQQIAAAKYEAAGQCTRCGAFRLDGQPPTVHRHSCTLGPDGSQLEPQDRR